MLLFVDTETNGLPTRRGAHWSDVSCWPRIVSIAWIVMNERGMVDRQHHIIKPAGFTIPFDAERVHGISTARALREGKDWASVASSLLAATKRHTVQKMIAHNIDFDRPIILAELRRAGLPTELSELPTFCTMKSHAAKTGGRWPRLSDLYLELTGMQLDDAHDALADVEACVSCYQKMEAQGSGSDTKQVVQTVEDDEAQELITAILEWAEDKHWFDTDFVDQMQDRLDEGRELTDGQLGALRRIAARFGIG